MAVDFQNWGGIYSLYGLTSTDATGWASRQFIKRVKIIIPKISLPVPSPSQPDDIIMIERDGYASTSDYNDYLMSYCPTWVYASLLCGYGDDYAINNTTCNRGLDTAEGMFVNTINLRDYMAFAGVALWDDRVGDDAFVIATRGPMVYQNRVDTLTGTVSGLPIYAIPVYGVRGGSNAQAGAFMAVDPETGRIVASKYGMGYVSCLLQVGSWQRLSEDDNSFNIYHDSFFGGMVENENPMPISVDPYTPGGTSQGGVGGGGSYSDSSDPIDFPALPTLSALSTGFVTLYTPTIAQLYALSSYMWNEDPTTIEFWKKIVADPIDLILGLNIVPVSTSSTGSKSVVVGAIDTGVSMNYTTTQYVEVDCGSITVPEFWGAYLDYSPYTKVEIYLPYCGTHPLIADEIIGKTVAVKYHIDLLSGALIAYVKCGNSILYQFAGTCGAQIPVTADQFGDMIRSAVSIGASIGSMIATDGATAPMAVGSIASVSMNSMGLKPSVEKSGAIGGMSGQLGVQTPYIILTRPKQCIPESQNAYIGYPTYITKQLSDVYGYVEISSIHIENVPATGAELEEIETILKGGVIL